MKKLFFIVIAFLMFGITSVLSQNSDELQGAWEVVYTEYIYTAVNDTLYGAQFENPSVKLLTKKHFAFGHQTRNSESITGGGGIYSYDGMTYTEHIKYHTVNSVIGKSVMFKSKLEGDNWTISGVISMDDGDVKMKEIWKRIE